MRQLKHEDLLVGDSSLERLSMDSRTHLMVERHRRRSGEVRDVETYASALVVDGRPTLFVIVHDVTVRRLAEEATRVEKGRLAVTLRHVKDGVITADDQGVILLLNQKAEEILGWRSVEAVGRPLSVVLRLHHATPTGEPGERMEMPWDEVGGKFEVSAFESIGEVALRQRGGGVRLLEISGSPIRRRRDISGLVLVMRDVTDRRRIEGELLRAQKMEALGILAGGIAHDFNNLLTVLLGNLSLLSMDGGVSEKGRRNVENAETAVMRARDLAQQLLTFSRGGAPVRKAASVAEVARESAEFVLRGSTIRSRVELPDDLWVAEIDPSQINQVLNNLLINAMQAMSGGGTIHVVGENVLEPPPPLEPRPHLAIHVQDEGPGIAEEHLDRIFDPYFSTKDSGRGLGLTSAYSIIKQHDGLLTVSSRLGEGTTFSIYLPASKEALETKQKGGKIPVAVGERILIMDDEQGVRLVLEAIVERLGYRPTTVPDGESAVERYRLSFEEGHPYALVIMDLTIPGGMGGQEALAHMLEIDPGVKAVVVSGYSNNPVLARYGEYGFRDRVSKPFKVEELAQVLARVIASED